MHRGTDCAEGNQSRLPSAQNVTLCTKCSALHKTSPHTGPTSSPWTYLRRGERTFNARKTIFNAVDVP